MTYQKTTETTARAAVQTEQKPKQGLLASCLLTAMLLVVTSSSADPVRVSIGPPEEGDIEPMASYETLTKCLSNDWRLVDVMSEGPWSFKVWVEDQTLLQMANEETIDMQITWDIQKIIKNNDYSITYLSSAWEGGWTNTWGVEHRLPPSPKVAIYNDEWSLGNCAGIMFDTGTTYFGDPAEITIDVIYEDLVWTFSENFESFHSTTNTLETATTAKVTASVGTESGVSTELSASRTVGQAATLATSKGDSATITPTMWTGATSYAVGGGGPVHWACDLARDMVVTLRGQANLFPYDAIHETCEELEGIEDFVQEPVKQAMQ